MLTFILATWSLVGIISGLILSKLDCTTVRVKDTWIHHHSQRYLG